MRDIRKAIVIMNQQHRLFNDQQDALNGKFSSYEIVLVPQEGWTRQEMEVKITEIMTAGHDIVFLSPVPYMLMKVSKLVENEVSTRVVYLFHRDVRFKGVEPCSVKGHVPWQLIA